MNAPATTAQLDAHQVELIPLGSIALSTTAGQELRRQGYHKPALEELAASIRDMGVMFAVLVRPGTGRGAVAKFELVAGERRYLASGIAGLAHIPARILPLTDVQVLKAQAIENLQREALDPLAEAQGYKELIAGGVPAEAIGDMIGKSRSYVYARVRLTALADGVQTALAAGKINASQALLFARVPTHKLQEAALATLEKWDYQGRGEALSFRHTARIFFQDKAKGLLIPLAQVPFSLTDETYHTFGPKQGSRGQEPIYLPACTVCPKRSGNDAELLAALDNPNVCTDRICHDIKAKQAFERRRDQAQKDGRAVLTGEDAAKVLPTTYGTRGYVDLDTECEADEYERQEPRPKGGYDDPAVTAWEERAEQWEPRTYRQLLDGDVSKLDAILVQDPKNKSRLRELAPDKAVAALLKEKGIKERIHRDTTKPPAPEKPEDPEARRKAEERQSRKQAEAQLEERIESEYQKRLLRAVHASYKGPLKRDDLELIAQPLVDDYDTGEVLGVLFKKPPSLATMNDRDLMRLIMAMLVGREYTNGGSDRTVVALAKRLKLDPKAIRKQVAAELTPKLEAAPQKPAKSKRK